MRQEENVAIRDALSPTLAVLPDWNTAARAVVDAGKRASARGWVPATSGNFSVRAAGGQVAITRSGVDKGSLGLADILRQPVAKPLLPGSSAEAGLHLRLYADHADIGAVFHTHSLAAAVLGRLYAAAGAIVLEGWEMQKALQDIRTHEARVVVPVFANTQDIEALARDAAARCAQPPAGAVLAPGYVIAGHGLYAWGADAAQAWRHLEALDVLLGYLLALRDPSPPL
jgi:methylthioribulose-1-phosphate dehydratase